MSDSSRKETVVSVQLSESPPADLTTDAGTRKLVVGAVSGKANVLIEVEDRDPVILSPQCETGAVLVKTIKDLQQAWGVAVNHKDQLIVVEGRDKENISQNGTAESSCDASNSKRDKSNESIHTDSSGNKSNGDRGGGRVSIFTSQGEFIKSFGKKGSHDGEFNAPRGVAVDDEDNIYVVDKLNSRIQKFSSNGDHIVSVGTQGYGELNFDWPKGIGIHPYTKYVYVTEANNHRVQILKPDLTYHGMIGAKDENGKPIFGDASGEFNTPLGVTFDKAGRVYVTDAINNRVQVFTEEGEFIGSFGDGMLKFPGGICIDENDILYVTEVDNYQVSVFRITDSAQYAFQLLCAPYNASSSSSSPHAAGFSSTSRSVLSSPLSIHASYSYSQPTFLTTFGKGPNMRPRPYYHGGIAINKQGIVYVTDSGNDDLQMFLL